MQAVMVHEFGTPDVLRVEEFPDLKPGPGQILVDLHAAGINPVDTYIRSGQYAKLPSLPYTPGGDGAGIVASCGEKVEGWDPGERVFLSGSISGTYASQALCEPAHLHRLPENSSFAQGACLGVPYATAHAALLHRGQGRPGERVLVHGGTGGVGLASIQWACTRGMVIFATGGTDEGLELMRREGAHYVFNHHDNETPNRILKQSKGAGMDLIVEMLANVNLGGDLGLLAPGGRVVVVGSRGPVEINPRDFMMRNADVRGLMLGGLSAVVRDDIYREMGEELLRGTLKPIVAESYALDQATRAHEVVMSSGALGKIILECR